MAGISKVTLPNGSTYDIKDATARTQITSEAATRKAADDSINNAINSLKSNLTGAMHYVGETTTPIADGMSVNYTRLEGLEDTTAITINGNKYYPQSGDVVIYQNKEFVATVSYIGKTKEVLWNEFGDPDARIRMTEINWYDLKQLRDNGQLIPGMQYRIIDYDCYTTQKDTQSAAHQFDIIVTADSTNKLNEVARAIQHEYIHHEGDDEYFSNCNLAAWKIWYCLDNDTKRFAWADETDGKGVIYRMIDEHGNDCPYDFKNIMFKCINSNSNYYYTFASVTSSDNKDNSLSEVHQCYSNTIKEYINNDNKRQLNNIVFFDNNSYCNSFGCNCHDNIFYSGCNNNSFGNDCYDITFDYECCSNSFGNNCNNIVLGILCSGNSFGDKCSHIIFKRIDYSKTNISNYNFANGLNYANSEYIVVGGASGRPYETKVEIDSNGVLKTFCLADLIVPKDDDAYPYSSIFIGEI